jgi:hypothetical protein
VDLRTISFSYRPRRRQLEVFFNHYFICLVTFSKVINRKESLLLIYKLKISNLGKAGTSSAVSMQG